MWKPQWRYSLPHVCMCFQLWRDMIRDQWIHARLDLKICSPMTPCVIKMTEWIHHFRTPAIHWAFSQNENWPTTVWWMWWKSLCQTTQYVVWLRRHSYKRKKYHNLSFDWFLAHFTESFRVMYDQHCLPVTELTIRNVYIPQHQGDPSHKIGWLWEICMILQQIIEIEISTLTDNVWNPSDF